MTARYVNTASSPGGDGTTNATAGDNRAYASLNEAEAAMPATLTDWWRIICEGQAADTTAVTLAGTTTTAANYIEVWTDPAQTYGRHDGKWNTGKYRLEVSNYGDTGLVTVNVPYVILDGLQIKSTFSTPGSGHAIKINHSSGGTPWVKVSNSILQGVVSGSFYNFGIEVREGTAYIWNNIFYNWNSTYGFGMYVGTATDNAYFYNNTIVNCTYGIRQNVGVLTAVNNIVKGSGNTNAYVGTFTSSDYNSTDGTDNTEGGANSLQSQIFSFVNTGAGTEDFHLLLTDTGALNHGIADPGSGLFSDDIDGQTRSGTWDIGADEYVAAGGLIPYPFSRGARGGHLALSGGLQ